VSFNPEIVLPTQTSDATVVYTLATEAPSGLPLTLVIREELELLDGTLRRAACAPQKLGLAWISICPSTARAATVRAPSTTWPSAGTPPAT